MSDFLVSAQMEEPEPASPGLTPLVDVVFQLLVFFILTSTFATPALDITLPQLQKAAEAGSTQAWRVEVSASGDLALDGEPVSRANLPRRFARSLDRSPERQAVIIAADSAVPYGDILQLMQTLGNSGARQLLFEHRPASSQP